MLNALKDKATTAVPPREILVHVGTLFAILIFLSFVGMGEEEELVKTLQSIGRFIQIIILGVAVPNGAYGFLQYMTAGSNVDQDEKGRNRIRNTFIGLAGVAVIEVAVNMFHGMIQMD